MSNYVGDHSGSPIVDMMIDAVIDRGYDRKEVGKAVSDWQKNAGEDRFWVAHIGPAIDYLESMLGHYGLHMEDE